MNGDNIIQRHTTFHGIRIDVLIALFIVVVPLGVYWPVTTYGFINYDDHHYVVDNPWVRIGLTDTGIRWALTATRSVNWHPITWVSHMTDSQFYGLDAGLHHLSNLLFHILNTLLLFIIFRQMTGCFWKSGLVATLFALHPLNVESVAWVSQRKTVVSTFFLFLTLWGYIRFVSYPCLLRYSSVLAFYLLGLMSKPMLVTVPFLLLLFDYWPLERFRTVGIRALVFEKTPLFILSTASCILTYVVQQSGGATSTFGAVSLSARISNAAVGYTLYLGKMVWPYNLAVLYPHARAVDWMALVGALLLLCVVSVVVAINARRKPYVIVGWLWYLGTLVPVIGLVQVGLQSIADRYVYVPLIGIFVMAVWGGADVIKKTRVSTALTRVMTACLILYFAFITARQLTFWSDSITLYERTLAVTTDNFAIHHNLGSALIRRGRFQEAAAQFKQALRINPNLEIARKSMANALAADDADTSRLLKEIAANPSAPEPYLRLGNLYKQNGDLQKAIVQYEKVLKRSIGHHAALEQLGIVHAMAGNYREAIPIFRNMVALAPDYANAYYLLAGAYARQKKQADAVHWIKEAIRNGHFDHDRIMNDPNFDAIRGTKAFRAILSISIVRFLQ